MDLLWKAWPILLYPDGAGGAMQEPVSHPFQVLSACRKRA